MPNGTEKKVGLICPRCNERIMFSIADLLYRNFIICPYCQLRMEMNVPSNIKEQAEKLIKPQSQIMETETYEDQQEESL
jgi:transcription elongation factor Elf1